MYRDELDALNALYEEQKKTNDLLEKLISALSVKETRKENVAHDTKGRGGGNRGKGS